MKQFVNLNRLLSLRDIDNNLPEWFLMSGNKAAGKTTDAIRLLVNRYLRYGEEFMIVFRWSYELRAASEMIEKTVVPLFWEKIEFISRPVASGLFYQILICKNPKSEKPNYEVCGYSVSLNTVDTLKKYSNYFHKVQTRFMDEFQAENNHYTKDELKKWTSLQILSSRGIGEPYRYTRTILCSNSYSLLNPYFIQLGIHKRLTKDTKILRGKGWVFEQVYNENSAKEMESSSILNSISCTAEMEYATQNRYLDNTCFVEKMSGKSTYVMTLVMNGNRYGVREFENGILHVSDSSQHCNNEYSFSSADHDVDLQMVSHTSFVYMILRNTFELGKLRFKSIEEKNVVLDILSM